MGLTKKQIVEELSGVNESLWGVLKEMAYRQRKGQKVTFDMVKSQDAIKLKLDLLLENIR